MSFGIPRISSKLQGCKILFNRLLVLRKSSLKISEENVWGEMELERSGSGSSDLVGLECQAKRGFQGRFSADSRL